MDYLEVFRAMLADLRSDLRHWLRGNTEQYLYHESIDAHGAVRDANAAARLRLCYALAYSEKPVPECEKVLRALYDAECTAAERTGSTAGDALLLLTAMLKEYEPSDSPLFARAGKLNPADCKIAPPEAYQPEDCLRIAAETGMRSYLLTLLLCASRMYDEETVRVLRERYTVSR